VEELSESDAEATPDDFYDEVDVPPPTQTILSGDYVWRHGGAVVGTPGGPFQNADVLISTALLHSGQIAPGARLVVDGRRLAVTDVTPFYDYGELVVAAKLISAGAP
jgi:hypothetical protein